MADISVARPSSTIVLVRQGDLAPEVFMVHRHAATDFGGAHAFPGGIVDAVDAQVHTYCRGLTDAVASSRLGVKSGGLDAFSAAIRELFEESGVLLADLKHTDLDLASVRASLNDGSLRWTEFLQGNEISLQAESLHYIAHWVTPPTKSKRYSTRFFLAQLPSYQLAEHCGLELTDSVWSTASDMLAAVRQGSVKMFFPTIRTLENIARFKTTDALVEWARSSAERGITTMLPVTILRNGKNEIVLPGDSDYPGADS